MSALRENGIIEGDGLDTVRKDIEKVLKPYKILPEFPLRDGYFAGTAILSALELTKVFDVPKWSLGDVEFLRWIVGFGGNGKVVQPEALMVKVKGIGDAIVRVYE